MPNYTRQDTATSNVLAWTAHAANAVEDEEAGADADEPPDQVGQHAAVATERNLSSACHSFQKTLVQRPREHTESLLTRALQSQSEDETAGHDNPSGLYPRRRRSITSNTSLASTAGFTSDTGITTPPRTNSPSPRLLSLGFAPVQIHKDITSLAVTPLKDDTTPKPLDQPTKSDGAAAPEAAQAQTPQRKRCISFACAPVKPTQQANTKGGSQNGKPASTTTATIGADVTPKPAYAQLAQTLQPVQPVPSSQLAQPKRTCIRFVCPTRPSADLDKTGPLTLKVDAQNNRKVMARKPSPAPEPRSPTSVRKSLRGSSSARSPRPATRSSASRQSSHSPLATRSKKYYNAQPEDLDGESSHFHEFASDAPIEEDWIRRDKAAVLRRLTIDDTLEKELAIRRLGKEAEEEAEEEEQEENEGEGNEDEDDEEENEDDEDDEDGDEIDTVEGDDDHQLYDSRFAGYSSGSDASDGYNTDNEIGFASSDDEEDDELVLWTMNHSTRVRHQQNRDNDHSTLHQSGTPVFRRFSVDEHSDSSGFMAGQAKRQERPKNKELASTIRRPATPELPDSTDFVCGTFDEDRPLEEAYLSHIEARKRGKLHVIPQDIDPSFPTSDPEDETDNDSAAYKQRMQKQQHGSAEERFWELDDLHHDQHERRDGGRKKKAESPKRYHSPPPPKARGRSPVPRHLFAGRRLRSPAPKAAPVLITAPSHAPITSPPASPVDMPGGGGKPAFQALAFRPGLTTTKSLPRPSAIFRHQQQNQHLQAQPQPLHTTQTQSKPYRRPKANSTASVKQPRHVRGAIDIVKGLEQKRQRRKEKFHQKYCNRARKGQVLERRPQRGEGAERMREVGLLMAGKIGQGNYVLSV